MSRKGEGRKGYTEEFKAEVLAALSSGLAPSDVSRQYKVPRGTIVSWQSRQTATPVALVATGKREEIGALLVGFLEKSIRTLSVQVEQFGDKAWLQNQSASEAAEIFGAITDRTFRLLEALESGAPEAEAGPPSGSKDG